MSRSLPRLKLSVWALPWREGVRLLRRLGRAKGFTLAVTLCLGLGLGAVAQIASVVDAFLLRPLPFRQPDRLLLIWKTFDNDQARGLQYFLRPTDFESVRREATRLEVAAQQPSDLDIVTLGEGAADGERISGARVSGNFFPFLGLNAAAGRLLLPDDERLEAPVAVVSTGFAARRYGDGSPIGSRIAVDGRPHEIVGVVATAEGYPSGAEVWVPLTRTEFEGRLGFQVLGRIAADSTRSAALEEIASLSARLRELDPEANGNAGLAAENLQRNLTGDLRVTLAALGVTVFLLLAIAVANTACLVLARARRRAEERVLQRMLGAPRWRLFLDTLAENTVLALAGTALGLVLSSLLLPLLLASSPVQAFSFAPIAVGGRVLLLLGILGTAIGILFALIASAAGGGGEQALAGHRGSIRTPRGLSALVVVDVALTTILLVGAAALLETVHSLVRTDPGFDPDGLVTFGVSASEAWTSDHPRRIAFISQVVEAAERQPGVVSASAVHKLPMSAPEYWWGFNVEGRPPAAAGGTDSVLFRLVTPGYFVTLRQPLLAGRTLTAGDDDAGRPVLVANRAFAERYFGGAAAALGKRVKGGRYESAGDWVTIVGVVGNARERGLAEKVVPALYIPMPQWDRRYLSRMSVVFRHGVGGEAQTSPIPALRQAVRELDREAVVFDAEPMTAIVGRSLRRQRFAMALLSTFALLALVQASAGLYGVLSYSVASSRREIGLRMALGARPREVRTWVLLRGAVRGGAGLVVGLLAAVVLSRSVRSVWTEIETVDLVTCLVVSAVTAGVVLLATALPAHRAARIDPARTLHGD